MLSWAVEGRCLTINARPAADVRASAFPVHAGAVVGLAAAVFRCHAHQSRAERPATMPTADRQPPGQKDSQQERQQAEDHDHQQQALCVGGHRDRRPKNVKAPGEVVTQGLAAPLRPTRDIRVEATTTMTRKPQAGSATGKSSSRRRQEDITEASSRPAREAVVSSDGVGKLAL